MKTILYRLYRLYLLGFAIHGLFLYRLYLYPLGEIQAIQARQGGCHD